MVKIVTTPRAARPGLARFQNRFAYLEPRETKRVASTGKDTDVTVKRNSGWPSLLVNPTSSPSCQLAKLSTSSELLLLSTVTNPHYLLSMFLSVKEFTSSFDFDTYTSQTT